MNFSRIEYHALDIDDANFEKIQKHGVKLGELKLFFTQDLLYFSDPRSSNVEKRLIAVGRSTGTRYMFVAFTFREIKGETFIRPISARFIHRNSKEEKTYEEIKKKITKSRS